MCVVVRCISMHAPLTVPSLEQGDHTSRQEVAQTRRGRGRKGGTVPLYGMVCEYKYGLVRCNTTVTLLVLPLFSRSMFPVEIIGQVRCVLRLAVFFCFCPSYEGRKHPLVYM